MNQIERLYPGDMLIAVVLIWSQSWIAWNLFSIWKNSLARRTFLLLESLLFVLWTICAISLGLNVDHVQTVPSPVRAFASAVQFIWTILSATGIVVFHLYRLAIGALGPRLTPGRRRFLQGAAVAAVAAPAAALGYGAFLERKRFIVREVDFPIPGLHPDLDGFRVAQISDIHAGPYLNVRDVSRVVDIANELKPNLALVTGDLISQEGDPLDATIDQLARLRSDTGILGCMGNHEVYARCEDYTAERARRRGIEFLRGAARQVSWGKGVLNVAGVDFQPFRQKARYLHDAARLVAPGVSNLLLSHNPDVFPVAVRQGFDAIIGGHTHGGQVNVEILHQNLNFARFFTPFVAGLYRLERRSCYVTAGIGTIGMPVRLGVPPEITLLYLRRA